MEFKILKILTSHGWKISDKKEYGSEVDLWLEHNEGGFKNYMLIEDGVVSLKHTTYHIYTTKDLKDKIFEGVIKKPNELKIVLKVLGYKKQI